MSVSDLSRDLFGPVEDILSRTLDDIDRRVPRIAREITDDTLNAIRPDLHGLTADLREIVREVEGRSESIIDRSVSKIAETAERQLGEGRRHVSSLVVQAEAVVERIVERSASRLGVALEEQLAMARGHADGLLDKFEMIVDRRISSVEDRSLKTMELAIGRMVEAAEVSISRMVSDSAASLKQETDRVVDGVVRRLQGVVIPATAILTAARIHTVLGGAASTVQVIALSASAAAAATTFLALGTVVLARRDGSQAVGAMLRSAYRDFAPFLIVAVILSVVQGW